MRLPVAQRMLHAPVQVGRSCARLALLATVPLHLVWAVTAFTGPRLPLLGLDSGGVLFGLVWFWVAMPLIQTATMAMASLAGSTLARLAQAAERDAAAGREPRAPDDHVRGLGPPLRR